MKRGRFFGIGFVLAAGCAASLVWAGSIQAPPDQSRNGVASGYPVRAVAPRNPGSGGGDDAVQIQGTPQLSTDLRGGVARSGPDWKNMEVASTEDAQSDTTAPGLDPHQMGSDDSKGRIQTLGLTKMDTGIHGGSHNKVSGNVNNTQVNVGGMQSR